MLVNKNLVFAARLAEPRKIKVQKVVNKGKENERIDEKEEEIFVVELAGSLPSWATEQTFETKAEAENFLQELDDYWHNKEAK